MRFVGRLKIFLVRARYKGERYAPRVKFVGYRIGRSAVQVDIEKRQIDALGFRCGKGKVKSVKRTDNLKAEFLSRFATFIEWPQGGESRTFTIGVVGRSPFNGYLDKLAARKIKNRAVSIRYINDLAQIDGCDIVFIGHYEPDGRFNTLETLVDAGVRVRLFGTNWPAGTLERLRISGIQLPPSIFEEDVPVNL